ncbi:MAG: S8 family serine peptidase [Pseudomonadota bacterium]
MPERLSATLILSTFLLTACGGGGGGGGSNNPATTAPPANSAPTANFSATPSTGNVPLRVVVDASASNDSDGDITQYLWDFGNDGGAIGVTAETIFTEPGDYTIRLTVTDDDGASNQRTVQITASASADPVRVSGTVNIIATTQADSDTNDRFATPTSNNSFTNAQAVSNPLLAGGFVNVPDSGVVTGALYPGGDRGDFYRISLTGSEQINLQIAERIADLDLRLWDVNQVLVDASLSVTPFESVSAPGPGVYFIEVFPFAGASNYVLSVGEPATTSSRRQLTRLSDSFVSGEILLRTANSQPDATGQNLDANRSSYLAELRQHAEALWPDGPLRLQLPAAAMSTTTSDATFPAGGKVSELLTRRYQTLLNTKQLAADATVMWAEPNARLAPHATPDDPIFASQWHYSNINLPTAWDTTTGSQDVIVAVVDTGVVSQHPDLRDNLVAGYDFVSNVEQALDGDGRDPDPEDPGDRAFGGSSSFHGTHVGGTVAASTDNGRGVSGVGWQTRLMPIRAIGRDGATIRDLVQAIRYAAGLSNDTGTLPVQAADIINLSLGGPVSSQIMQDTINEIASIGVLVVASAGNDNSDLPQYPAAYDNVFAVSATRIDNSIAGYSNRGQHVDLAAPGGSLATDSDGDGIADGVISTFADDSDAGTRFSYAIQSGTSMSAPHVAGVMALMKSIYADLDSESFRLALVNGDLTDDLGEPGHDPVFGYGLINAAKAMLSAQRLAGGQVPDPGPVIQVSPARISLGAVAGGTQLTVRNTGSGSLNIDEIVVSEPWLSIQADNINAGGLGTYALQVERNGLAEGNYTATLTFRAAGAADRVLTVTMQVSPAAAIANAGLVYIILVDDTNNTVATTSVTAVDGAYPFTLPSVPPGRYRMFAGTDADDDSALCDAGEACGAYPTLDDPGRLNINADTNDLSFETSFRLSLDVNAVPTADPASTSTKLSKHAR